MSTEESVEALRALGFTGLESEVYTFLVQESPATGYRIAQALGKPAANVYKAIEALEGKETVLAEEGTPRLYRAVPTDELLMRLDRDFQGRRAQAKRALSKLHSSPQDDRVYPLRSREQVLERARTMLLHSQRLVLMDAFPDPLEALRPDIEATAARGVHVILKVFLPTELPGVEVVPNPRGEDVMAMYPGQWLILIADGAEVLIASLDTDRQTIHQAIWSRGAALSWILHASFAAEILLSTLFNALGDGTSLEELQAAVAPFLRRGVKHDQERTGLAAALWRQGMAFDMTLPGYIALKERFSTGAKGEKDEGVETKGEPSS